MFFLTFTAEVDESRRCRMFRIKCAFLTEERARRQSRYLDDGDKVCILAVNIPRWLPVLDTLRATRWARPEHYRSRRSYIAITPVALPDSTSHLLGLYDNPQDASSREGVSEVLEFVTYSNIVPCNIPALIEADF